MRYYMVNKILHFLSDGQWHGSKEIGGEVFRAPVGRETATAREILDDMVSQGLIVRSGHQYRIRTAT